MDLKGEKLTQIKRKKKVWAIERVNVRKKDSFSQIIYLKNKLASRLITLVEMSINFWLCKLTQSWLKFSIVIQNSNLLSTHYHWYHKFHSTNLKQFVHLLSIYIQGPLNNQAIILCYNYVITYSWHGTRAMTKYGMTMNIITQLTFRLYLN